MKGHIFPYLYVIYVNHAKNIGKVKFIVIFQHLFFEHVHLA